jgi:hypothetical protein
VSSIKNGFHQALLHAKLDELFLNYQTVLRWEDLYIWYGVQKIAVRTYRDIEDSWHQYLMERGVKEDAFAMFQVEFYCKRSGGEYEAILRRKLPVDPKTRKPETLASRCRREL